MGGMHCQEVLWDWLWHGLWWHDYLLGGLAGVTCPLHLGLLFPGDLAHLGLLAPLELLPPHQGVLQDGHWVLYCICTGECSGLGHHRCSKTVTVLDIDLGVGSSQICCSRG